MAQYNLFRKKDKSGKEIGPWYARKQRKGVPPLYFNCRTEDKRSAKKRADDWYEGLVADEFGEKPRPTFAEAAVKMAEKHVPNHRLKTIERYTEVLIRFVTAFDGKRLDQIDQAALYEYEHARRQDSARGGKRKITAATINYEFKVLNILFQNCDLWGWEGIANPVPAYRKRRKDAGLKASGPKKRYYSQEEEDRLLAVVPAIWRNRMVFAVETGLRKNEQFGITWDQMDIPNRKLTIPAHLAKGKRERDVPLTPRAIAAAQAMRLGESPWVCPREDGEQFSPGSIQVWRRMQAFGKAAQVENVDWHAWRKTCGCRLLQVRRLRMEEVQMWLGHRSIQETERAYAFLNFENLQEAVHETQGRVTRINEVVTKATMVIEQFDKSKQIRHLDQ